MPKKIINSNKAPVPVGPYSQAVMCGDLLFCSGMLPIDPETGKFLSTGVEDEAKQILKNLKAVLNEAGLDFKNVVKTTIFLKDMNNFKLVNELYSQCFDKDYPARETVEVSRLPGNVNVEISMIATK